MLSLLFAALSAVTVHAPKADLQLDVARSAAEREYGLMNRTSLAPHTGMIFVFAQDAPVQFWMKNTLIPLDMVWVGADGTVRQVDANVPVVPPKLPDDQIPLESGVGQFVIELRAGEAAADGIEIGTKLNLVNVPAALPN
ncbi:MAG: DUF192 domain-containing protein [Candidatus Eremiobacteraeota bacterium]|nr:DUF192 domain-containing protein [Candidatus Eremiobacteraeota bacterium]MBV8433535.1 DUF192 domain-containing protein [Candidatus Eremiobacteraeota bacterium]MBV8655875.1 DUF192 domain-containing protein [Candidatus Eremiobacteraeota bacterium]